MGVTEVERRKRQRDLKMTVNDPLALTLYNDFLIAVSNVRCRQRKEGRGGCWPCQPVNTVVQAAYASQRDGPTKTIGRNRDRRS